jgi:hypothetical protein
MPKTPILIVTMKRIRLPIVGHLRSVDPSKINLGLRLLGPLLKQLEVRNRSSRQHTDNRDNNHKLDEGKTPL